MRRILNPEDLRFFLLGSTVLSTGGGGIAPSEERFQASLEKLDERKKFPVLIDSKDLPSGSFVFERSGVGGGIQADVRKKYSLTPGSDPYYERWVRGFNVREWIDKMIERRSRTFPLSSWSRKPSEDNERSLDSYLSEMSGIRPYARVIGEIGPNGFYDIIDSIDDGCPIVDGDLAGHRAVPELSLSMLNVHEIDPGKVVFLSAWGDLIKVERVLDYQRLEDIARHLAISSGGAIGGMHAISSEDLKKSVVPGSISKTITTGKSILSFQKGNTGIDEIAKAAGGSVIFDGKIDNFMRETRDSFHMGDIFISGTGNYSGKELRIWFKNENHVTWVNDESYVCSPDLVCVIDNDTGTGIPNALEREWYGGRRVCVIGVPAWKMWYTPRGLSIFGPKHFGFDMKFRPLQDIISG